MIKERRSEIGGDLEPPWKPTTIDTQREGDSQEEPTPEKSPSETPNDDTVVAEASPLKALGEISLSCVTDLCDRKNKEERSRRSDENVETFCDDNDRGRSLDGDDWGRPPEEEEDRATALEEENDVVTVDDGWLARDLGFFLRDAACDREERKMKASAECFIGNVDQFVISLGQAQFYLMMPTQNMTMEREMELTGFDWTLQKMGHVFNSRDQAQTIDIKPTIY